MPGVWIGAGGAWKKVSRLSVGTNSANKLWKVASIGAGGAWKKFFSLAGVASFSFGTYNYGVSFRTVGIRIKANGSIWVTRAAGTSSYPPDYIQVVAQWVAAGLSSDFDVRLTQYSGTLTPHPSSKPLNTWYSAGGEHNWFFYVADGNQNTTYQFFGNLEFRIRATGEIVQRSLAIWIPD